MPVTFTRSANVNADGNSAQIVDSVQGDESSKVTLTLPTGVSGVLSTRTDNDTGIVNAVGHGITTSDFVSVFWTDPTDGSEKCRMNMDVTAVGDADHFTVDLGQGDNLPLAASTLIWSKVVSRVVAWDGVTNGMLAFMASLGNRRGSITAQAVGTLIGLAGTDLFKQLKTASAGYCWLSGVDGTWPGDAADILMLTAALGDTNGGGTATFVGLDT